MAECCVQVNIPFYEQWKSWMLVMIIYIFMDAYHEHLHIHGCLFNAYLQLRLTFAKQSTEFIIKSNRSNQNKNRVINNTVRILNRNILTATQPTMSHKFLSDRK